MLKWIECQPESWSRKFRVMRRHTNTPSENYGHRHPYHVSKRWYGKSSIWGQNWEFGQHHYDNKEKLGWPFDLFQCWQSSDLLATWCLAYWVYPFHSKTRGWRDVLFERVSTIQACYPKCGNLENNSVVKRISHCTINEDCYHQPTPSEPGSDYCGYSAADHERLWSFFFVSKLSCVSSNTREEWRMGDSFKYTIAATIIQSSHPADFFIYIRTHTRKVTTVMLMVKRMIPTIASCGPWYSGSS